VNDWGQGASYRRFRSKWIAAALSQAIQKMFTHGMAGRNLFGKGGKALHNASRQLRGKMPQCFVLDTAVWMPAMEVPLFFADGTEFAAVTPPFGEDESQEGFSNWLIPGLGFGAIALIAGRAMMSRRRNKKNGNADNDAALLVFKPQRLIDIYGNLIMPPRFTSNRALGIGLQS